MNKSNKHKMNRLLPGKFVILISLFAISCTGKKASQVSEMILIPGGTFNMGGRSQQAKKDEFPRHMVTVSSFMMDATEVTNAQFAEFVRQTGYVTTAERAVDWEEMKKQVPEGTPKPADSLLQPGSLVFHKTSGPVNMADYSQWWSWVIGANWQHPEGPDSNIKDRMDHPVVHVSLLDAQAYAKWAGKRLPTEAEWEWAASGGDSDVNYPWGNEDASHAQNKANFWQGFFPYENKVEDGFATTAPVKSFPPNKFGLYDMAGNVWEWCNDKYDSEIYSVYAREVTVHNPDGSGEYRDPRNPGAPVHVVRGGSYLCSEDYCSGYRVSRRMGSTADSGLSHTGFRCVRGPGP